jgi:hypothetical protein
MAGAESHTWGTGRVDDITYVGLVHKDGIAEAGRGAGIWPDREHAGSVAATSWQALRLGNLLYRGGVVSSSPFITDAIINVPQ